MASRFPLPPATLPSHCTETGGELWAGRALLPTGVSPQSMADGRRLGVLKPVHQGTLGTWIRGGREAHLPQDAASAKLPGHVVAMPTPGQGSYHTACPEISQGVRTWAQAVCTRAPLGVDADGTNRALYPLSSYLPPSCCPRHGAGTGEGEARWARGTRHLGSRCLRACPEEVEEAGLCVSWGSKPLVLVPKFCWTSFSKAKLSRISRRQQQSIKESSGPFRAWGPECRPRSWVCDASPTCLPPQGLTPATGSSSSLSVLEKAGPAYKHMVNRNSKTLKTHIHPLIPHPMPRTALMYLLHLALKFLEWAMFVIFTCSPLFFDHTPIRFCLLSH